MHSVEELNGWCQQLQDRLEMAEQTIERLSEGYEWLVERVTQLEAKDAVSTL